MKPEFHIEHYLIDINKNQIINTQSREESATINVPPKALEVLLVLVAHAPNVVSVENLMETVWPRSVVSPNSVQRCIAQLRKAMGDNSKLQNIIRTHAKKGYSLEAKVECPIESQPKPVAESSNSTDHSVKDQPNTIYEPKESVTQAPVKEELANTSSLTTADAINSSSAKLAAGNKTFQTISKPTKIKLAMLACIILLLIISGFSLFPTSRHSFNFNTLTPAIVSDAKETNASYSPDGRYIAFHRFDGLCANNIWLKDTDNGQENQLTLSTGFYGPHQFTPDGTKLAFMAKESCQAPQDSASERVTLTTTDKVTIRHCWNLMTLNIDDALSAPIEPEIVVSCNDGELSDPVWLDNGNIAVLKKKANQWQVVKYMPGAMTEKTLYAPKQLHIYHLTYLSEKKQLIVIAINGFGGHVIQRLDMQGEIISSHVIERPTALSPHRFIYPIEDPNTEKLIFTTGKRLFSLSFTGQIEQLPQLNYNDLYDLSFSPNGEEILATQGKVDLDIAKTSFEALSKKHQPDFSPIASFNAVHQPYKSLVRTAHAEYDARFQPGGKYIAFISDRSAQAQIWLSNQLHSRQLTNFDIDTLVAGFAWSPAGNSIITSANAQLIEIDIDKTQRPILLDVPVIRVFQWTNENMLLIEIRQNGLRKLAKLSLSTNTLTVLHTGNVKWAQLSDHAGLIFLDEFNQFWQHTISGPILMKSLSNSLATKQFLIHDDNLWSINKLRQLWRFDLHQQTLNYIGEVDTQVNYVSDIQDDVLLLTQVIAARKDIVMLSHQQQ